MSDFIISPAGCHTAAVESIIKHASTPWWRFLARRRHLQSAYDWAARARKLPMTEIIAGFAHCRNTASNPSDSECAGPR